MLWFSNEQSLEEEAQLPPPGNAWAAIPAGIAHLPCSRQSCSLSQFSCIPGMLHHRFFPAPSCCTLLGVAKCFWSPPQTWSCSTSWSGSRWQDEVSQNYRIPDWFGLERIFKERISSHSTPSAGTNSTSPGCPKPHPAWPLILPGMGHSHHLRAMCFKTCSMASLWNHCKLLLCFVVIISSPELFCTPKKITDET